MITIFVKDNCPMCDDLKNVLSDRGLLEEAIISNNFEEPMKQGFRSAPVLQVGDKMMAFPEAYQWATGTNE